MRTMCFAIVASNYWCVRCTHIYWRYNVPPLSSRRHQTCYRVTAGVFNPKVDIGISNTPFRQSRTRNNYSGVNLLSIHMALCTVCT